LALSASISAAAPGLAKPPGSGAEAKKAMPPPGPVLAVVSLSKQRIHIYGSTGLLAQSAVSTGMAGHRTPPGVFTVLEKARYHTSNIYSGAPMPYMQRLTWSGIALHGGVVPGYPASHGCVRLPHSFAPQAFGMTTLGTRVVVTPDEPNAHAFEHASLPVPRLLPLPPGADGAAGKVAEAQGAILTDAGAPGGAKLYNPVERAKAMRSYLVREAAEKSRLAKQAADSVATRADSLRRAAAALRVAEYNLLLARRRHDAVAKTAETAAARIADPATAAPAMVAYAERTKRALTAAAADLAAAERRVEEADVIETMAREGSAAAVAVLVEAEHARREAAVALKLSEKADAPLSILVSKKAGKVFIRQAWTPIHEATVTFTEAGKDMLGTHVYLAVAPGDDGDKLNWLSVSLPGTAERPRQQRGKAQPPPADALTTETAASVLARFELPAATRQFIEERVWTGATLIVSDTGASPHETGLHTDFVVLTK
jgi:hypothetical protein